WRPIPTCDVRRTRRCATPSTIAGAAASAWRASDRTLGLEAPVKEDLEVLVTRLADPTAVFRVEALAHEAFAPLRVELHPAELAPVVGPAGSRGPIRRVAQQLSVEVVGLMAGEAPVVFLDHDVPS